MIGEGEKAARQELAGRLEEVSRKIYYSCILYDFHYCYACLDLAFRESTENMTTI